MSQQRKISRNNIVKENKNKEKANFATIAMRIFIILILVAMIVGLAIQIIAYK